MATHTEFNIYVTDLEPLSPTLESILPFFEENLTDFFTKNEEKPVKIELPRWLEDIKNWSLKDSIEEFVDRMVIRNYKTANGETKAALTLSGTRVRHYYDELGTMLAKICRYGPPDSYLGWWKTEGSATIYFAFCIKGKFLTLTQGECANLAISSLAAKP